MELEPIAEGAESGMRALELATALFLLALFAIGVFDLALSLFELVVSGNFTDPDAVIELIDTVLVLLVIVEVFRTVIAFARDEPVLRVVVNAAFIAIARKVISFRFSEFADESGTPVYGDALVAAAALAVLLLVLIAAFFVIRWTDPQPPTPDQLERMRSDGPMDGPVSSGPDEPE